MKKEKPLRILFALLFVSLLTGIYAFYNAKQLEINKEIVPKEKYTVERKKENIKNKKNEKEETKIEEISKENVIEENQEEIVLKSEPVEPIVYDGLTMKELGAKLDRTLSSNLSGYGNTFANLSIAYNMDPYLVVAIVMHETGCKWNCSYLVQNCNNIGGMKGSPNCAGSYRSFDTLEMGIQSYIENLYYNYYQVGLTTPEAINTKYAENTSWASYVNAYIDEIKEK